MNDGGPQKLHSSPGTASSDLETQDQGPNVWPAVILTLASAHLVIGRLVWGEIPLQTDTGIWAYFGKRMMEGARLYRDLWESKPPGIFFTFTALERAFGDVRAFLWLDALVTIAVCGMTYLVARRFATRGAALLSVCVLSVVMSHRVLADWGDNLEKFVALFEMTACWLILRPPPASGSVHRWLLAGLCCGLAAMFKQTGVLLMLILLIGLAAGWQALGVRHRGRALVSLLAGAALPWLFVFSWLKSNGAFGDFWRQVVVHDLQRAASPELEQSRVFEAGHWANVWRHLLLALVILGPAAAGCIAWLRRRKPVVARREPAPEPRHPAIGLFVIYAVMATLVFVIAPHGYGHYLLHAAPPAAVVAAWFISLEGSPRHRPLTTLVALAGLGIGIWQLDDHFTFMLYPRCDARRAYQDLRERSEMLSAAVAEISRADQSVMLWPADHAVSYHADRRTPLEMCQAIDIFRGRLHLLDPPLDVVIQRLMAQPPDVIVDWTPVAVDASRSGEAVAAPELLVPAGGYSLAEDPNPDHEHPEGRLLAPLKTWLRANYGGQQRVGGVCTVYYRGQRWRDWREYLLQPGAAVSLPVKGSD